MQEVRAQQTYRELLDCAGCRIFTTGQMNTCFQCKLAVESLLLLNHPPKYHTFHKTCTAAAAIEELSALQPLCPRAGHPQTECSILSDSSALEKSLFFSIHEPCQWWYKVSPTWIMIQVRAVIPWELNSGSLNVTKREELQQPSNSNLCGSKVPQRGAVGKGTHPVYALNRKEGTTPAIYFSPSSTIYTSLWETSLSTV